MSIPATIASATGGGRFHIYRPPYLDPDQAFVRWVIMSEEAMSQVPPTGRSDRLGREELLNMRSTLEAFITGAPVRENQELKKLVAVYPEIWEIRAFQRPAVRLFGWFMAKDIFVSSHCVARGDLESSFRPGRPCPKWDAAIEKCVRKRALLPEGMPLLSSPNFHDYVTT